MLIRTLLISLIFCLFACVSFAAIADSGGNTTFLWAAQAESNADNGGGAKTSAWNAGVPGDFIAAASGGPTSLTLAWGGADTANTVVEHTANAVKVVSGNPGQDWFRDCKTGTIGNFNFNTNVGLNGYYYITQIDDDSLSIDGLTYSGDFGSVDDDCDVRVGGAVKLLGGIANSDIADASTVNCDVLIKGDETLATDVTVASGGGNGVTTLRFLGVDSSWVRVVPTRTTASGGTIANYLLKTADNHMPKLTLDVNVNLLFNVDNIQVDGLWVWGNATTLMAGSAIGDQVVYSNCVFENTSDALNTLALEVDNYSIVYNCDVIASGATQDTIALRGGATVIIGNCRIINDSSSAASIGLQIASGEVANCVFYDNFGIALKWTGAGLDLRTVVNCTFEACVIGVSYPDSVRTRPEYVVNSIGKDCSTAWVDNLYQGTADLAMFAAFNHTDGNAADYDDFSMDVGFQDLTSDPLFVSEANDDYNLQSGSPAKNSGPFLTNRGAMSDAEAAGNGNGGFPATSTLGGLIQE